MENTVYIAQYMNYIPMWYVYLLCISTPMRSYDNVVLNTYEYIVLYRRYASPMYLRSYAIRSHFIYDMNKSRHIRMSHVPSRCVCAYHSMYSVRDAVQVTSESCHISVLVCICTVVLIVFATQSGMEASRYTNEPCHTWMSRVTHGWVMSQTWVMSHMNESCLIRMRYVTYVSIPQYWWCSWRGRAWKPVAFCREPYPWWIRCAHQFMCVWGSNKKPKTQKRRVENGDGNQSLFAKCLVLYETAAFVKTAVFVWGRACFGAEWSLTETIRFCRMETIR